VTPCPKGTRDAAEAAELVAVGQPDKARRISAWLREIGARLARRRRRQGPGVGVGWVDSAHGHKPCRCTTPSTAPDAHHRPPRRKQRPDPDGTIYWDTHGSVFRAHPGTQPADLSPQHYQRMRLGEPPVFGDVRDTAWPPGVCPSWGNTVCAGDTPGGDG